MSDGERLRDAMDSLATTEDCVIQLESIIDGNGSAVVFAPNPYFERAHRHPITDHDLALVNEPAEAEILLPAFRLLRDYYKAEIRKLGGDPS